MSNASPVSRAAAVAVYTKLLEAWNRRDAEGFASLFAEDGAAVGFDGSQMNGRDAIRAELTTIFADHVTASYVAKVRDVREPGPGVALVRAVCGMAPPGKHELNPVANAVQSALIIAGEHGGEAKIALFQNTPAAFHGRPQLAKALTEELTKVLRAGRVVDAG